MENSINLINNQLSTTCCICYEELRDSSREVNPDRNLIILNCNHLGHYECFRELRKCPICRSDTLFFNDNEDDELPHRYTLESHEQNDMNLKLSYFYAMNIVTFFIDVISFLVFCSLYRLGIVKLLIYLFTCRNALMLITELFFYLEFSCYVLYFYLKQVEELNRINIVLSLCRSNLFLLQSYCQNLTFKEIINNLLIRLPFLCIIIYLVFIDK